MDWGAEAQDRLQRIAACSEPGGGVTRLPFTAEHAAAEAVIADWMRRAGLSVRRDAACTLIGRREGPPGARTLLIGSHQDTVRRGGAYDGIMGIAIGCLALELLRARDVALPFAVEVLAFADEEGVRFPTALIGPRALAGRFDPAVLDMRDADGIRLADAIDGAGGDAAAIAGMARDPDTILGYIEAHIEQGPALEAANQPLGVVSAICGIERSTVTITGTTGHAGTVPMDMRRDALVTAARIVAEADRLARATPGLLATVGRIDCAPNVVNAIPERVSLSLELRSADDALRRSVSGTLADTCRALGAAYGTPVVLDRSYEQVATACDPDLSARLRDAPGPSNAPLPVLPSGATHDASAMADLCPIAMLFVQCRGGISHAPEEFAPDHAMGRAVETLAAVLRDMPG